MHFLYFNMLMWLCCPYLPADGSRCQEITRSHVTPCHGVVDELLLHSPVHVLKNKNIPLYNSKDHIECKFYGLYLQFTVPCNNNRLRRWCAELCEQPLSASTVCTGELAWDGETGAKELKHYGTPHATTHRWRGYKGYGQ